MNFYIKNLNKLTSQPFKPYILIKKIKDIWFDIINEIYEILEISNNIYE